MVEQMVNEYRPDIVSPPGETLEELLDERGMSQAELAERTGRPKKTINEIIQGKAAITPETALQFELVLGTPARFWLNREQQYREFLARQQTDAQLAQQVGWLDQVPVKDMVKAGWVAAHAEPLAQLREILQFYAIASPAQYEMQIAVFRKPQRVKSDPHAVAAWLRQGERSAQQIACAPYDEAAFRQAFAQARPLTRQPFAVVQKRLPELCRAAGVAVVIVPELPHTCVCGAARWLTPTKALIQLSVRYKTDDQFWFTFFHEAAHILLHNKREAFLDEEDTPGDEREAQANAFAADTLISRQQLARLLAQKGHYYFSERLVTGFAEQLGIAPGIVVGRLQHDGLLARTHLNRLKRTLTLAS